MKDSDYVLNRAQLMISCYEDKIRQMQIIVDRINSSKAQIDEWKGKLESEGENSSLYSRWIEDENREIETWSTILEVVVDNIE